MTSVIFDDSFEAGHYDYNGSIQVPNGWSLWDAQTDDPALHNAWNSDAHNRFRTPELRVLPADQLPPDEQPLFITSGRHCLKIFKGYSAWMVGLWRRVNMPSVTTATFSADIFGDMVESYGTDGKVYASNAQIRIYVNSANGKSYVGDWMPIDNGTMRRYELTFELQAGDNVLHVQFAAPLALKNAGIFTDRWKLEVDSDIAPPPTKPQPSGPYDLAHYMTAGNLIANRDASGVYKQLTTWAGEYAIQIQRDGTDAVRIVKNGEYEYLYWDDDNIYRREDTSEAPDRFYVLSTDGIDGAFYAPRWVNVGDRIAQQFHVKHYRSVNDMPIFDREGGLGGTLVIREWIPQLRLPSGVVVDDVLHIGYDGGEEYWFSPNAPLPQWSHPSGDRSYLLRGTPDNHEVMRLKTKGYAPNGRYFRPVAPPTLPPVDPQPPVDPPIVIDTIYRFEPFGWLLYRRAYDDGLRPCSAEYDRDGYRYLEAVNRAGQRRTYRVPFGVWDDAAIEIFADEVAPIEPPTITEPPPIDPQPPVGGEPFKFEAWPVPGYTTITQWFGARPSVYASYDLPGHEGIDIAAPLGAKIVAVADGTVVKTGDDRKSKAQSGHNYGVRVYIDHADGYQTVYAHLDRRAVDAGDIVKAGQTIGYADSTGNSTGHHLHITLKRRGATASGETNYPYDIIDPTRYLMAVMKTEVNNE